MTLFVTHSFSDLLNARLASGAADKNRPKTVFNYLTHYIGGNLFGETVTSSQKYNATTLNHLLFGKILGLKTCSINLFGKTQFLANFYRQSQRLRTALNPFKYALYSAFKQLQNAFKICQTVL